MSDIKATHWWFILYPDSAPADWRNRLLFTGLQAAISPLHNPDPEEGNSKVHYHVILKYSGPTTFKNVKRLCIQQFNATVPLAIGNLKGAYEYLTHINNPEKQQFDCPPDLVNGFDISKILLESLLDDIEMQCQIAEDIEKYNITEYFVLCRIYQSTDMEKFLYVSKKSIYYKTYLSSRKFTSKQDLELIERVTGIEN